MNRAAKISPAKRKRRLRAVKSQMSCIQSLQSTMFWHLIWFHPTFCLFLLDHLAQFKETHHRTSTATCLLGGIAVYLVILAIHEWPLDGVFSHGVQWITHDGSVCMPYMIIYGSTFTINIPQMLAAMIGSTFTININTPVLLASIYHKNGSVMANRWIIWCILKSIIYMLNIPLRGSHHGCPKFPLVDEWKGVFTPLTTGKGHYWGSHHSFKDTNIY